MNDENPRNRVRYVPHTRLRCEADVFSGQILDDGKVKNNEKLP